jgi:hypothetical protein
MVGPVVAARIEQRHELAGVRIECSDVRAFVVITVTACQREILCVACTAVLASDNMLDVKAHISR